MLINRCIIFHGQLMRAVRILQSVSGRLSSTSAGKDGEQPSLSCDSCQIGNIEKQPRIIIIGAGIAGLSAAERLVNCGLNDVVVLEGGNRPGGRIHSVNFQGCEVDLGAQWIYGSTVNNPIFNIATQEGLIKHPISKPDPFRGICFTSDGTAIDTYVYNKAKRLFQQFKEEAFYVPVEPRKGCAKDLWQFFVERINEAVNALTPYEQNFSRRVLFGLTNDIKSKMAADLGEIPLESLSHITDIPGGDVPIDSGFSQILSPILKKLPKSSLKLNRKCRLIKWSSMTGPRVMVSTVSNETFRGDYVIVTIPLGVLKESHEQLFNPALPQSKVDVIEKMGFGHVNKVYFHYEKPFWLPQEAYIRPSWDFNEMSNRKKWIHSIGMIEEAPHCLNSLMFEVGGTEAIYLEKTCDENIITETTNLIRKITADSSLPYPTSITKSKWSCNPLFLGGKSFLAKDCFPKDINTLANPLPETCAFSSPTVFFAGEAMTIGSQGTVHGARLSGIKEADRIIELTKRFGGPPPEEVPQYGGMKYCNYCEF